VGASGAEKVRVSVQRIQFPGVENRASQGSAATPGRKTTVAVPVANRMERTAVPWIVVFSRDLVTCEKVRICGC